MLNEARAGFTLVRLEPVIIQRISLERALDIPLFLLD